MLWIKALHIIFVICWFAGIFYLPRLFVYHAMSSERECQGTTISYGAKLYRFITPFSYLAIGFGVWLASYNLGYYLTQLWFWAKLIFVACMLAYHIQCGRYIRRFATGEQPHSHSFYRWFNEAPVIALFAIVILVVIRPFSPRYHYVTVTKIQLQCNVNHCTGKAFRYS